VEVDLLVVNRYVLYWGRGEIFVVRVRSN
jgi:hypothetical protein